MKTDNYSEKTSEARNEAASVHKKSRKVDWNIKQGTVLCLTIPYCR